MKTKLIIAFSFIIILAVAFILINRGGETENVNQEENIPSVETSTPFTSTGQFDTDKDLDGISDEEEAKLGTSAFEIDSDGDGLLDNEEINIFKTDPMNNDSDGDSYPDGYEVFNGFNPAGPGRL